MNKLPVLLVLSSTYPRWAGDYEPGFVHELSRRLTDRFRVIALVPSAPGAAPREILDGVEIIRYRYAPRRFETLVNDGGIVTNLRRRRWKLFLVPSFVLSQAWQLWRFLRSNKVDIIHAHWLIPQGGIAAFFHHLYRRCPPLLVTSHGSDLFALRGRLLSAIKRYVIGQASLVTVVSGHMRSELTRIGGDISKVSIQPMGVELCQRFIPDSTEPRSRHEILFVGRLIANKGALPLIRAMPDILSVCPDASLTVVGYGPEQLLLKTQARQIGVDRAVRFIGAVKQEDLPKFYCRAAVLVAPFVQAASGEQEGFGLVALEALGCGCPIVVSDLPGTRGALKDGPGCRRVPSQDSICLAKAVLDVLTNIETHLEGAANLRLSIKQRFDWSVVSHGYGKTLEACMQLRTPVTAGE